MPVLEKRRAEGAGVIGFELRKRYPLEDAQGDAGNGEPMEADSLRVFLRRFHGPRKTTLIDLD